MFVPERPPTYHYVDLCVGVYSIAEVCFLVHGSVKIYNVSNNLLWRTKDKLFPGEKTSKQVIFPQGGGGAPYFLSGQNKDGQYKK